MKMVQLTSLRVLGTFVAVSSVCGETWEVKCFGTAPLCGYSDSSPCPSGWIKINYNKGGNQIYNDGSRNYMANCGSSCTTGWHVFCKRQTKCLGLQWVGTAPACNSHYADCFREYQADVATKADHGDTWNGCDVTFGNACTTGKKVLCKDPVIKVHPVGSLTDGHQFKLALWNIFARPWIATHDGQYERQVQVPLKVNDFAGGQLDAIVFDEAWAVYDEFAALLTMVGFEYKCWDGATTPYKSGTGSPRGGVIIASRHPITACSYTKFYSAPCTALCAGPCHGADCLQAKGMLYARVAKQDFHYHIFGTHLQANYGFAERAVKYADHNPNYHADRVRQAKIVKDAIASLKIQEGEPMLFAGDLNSDWLAKREETQELMTVMGVAPVIPGDAPACTYCPPNDLVQIDYPELKVGEYLDYIGVLTAGAQPVTKLVEIISGAGMEVPSPLHELSTLSICTSSSTPGWVAHNGFDCKESKEVASLSDHKPVVASFTFAELSPGVAAPIYY